MFHICGLVEVKEFAARPCPSRRRGTLIFFLLFRAAPAAYGRVELEL